MDNPFFLAWSIRAILWVVLGLAALFIALNELRKTRNKKALKSFLRVAMIVGGMIVIRYWIYKQSSSNHTSEQYQGTLGMSVNVSAALFILFWMGAIIYIGIIADKMLVSSGRSKIVRYAAAGGISAFGIAGLLAMYLTF